MIPLSTTTITVLRVADADEYAEPYQGDDTTRRTVQATGIRAVIDRPGGNEQLAGGEQAVWDFGLVCDPTDLRYTDTVQDESTGIVYRVVWVMTYMADHVEAGLRVVQGEV